MDMREDSDISTEIDQDSDSDSPTSALDEHRRIRAPRHWPALFALMFTVPTSANLQITQPLLAMNQTYIGMGYQSRDEGDLLEAELYAPFQDQQWEEVGPLRIPITRYVPARLVFQGRLEFLPLTDRI